MENNNNQPKKRNPWMPHIIYAGALVLICLITALSYLWVKNKEMETSRYQAEKNAQVQLQQQQAELQKQESEQGKQKQMEESRNICLKNASFAYSTNWAKACRSQARFVENKINNCIDQGTSKAECQQTWGIPDYSRNCILPDKLTESLNDHYSDNKDYCYKEYPIN